MNLKKSLFSLGSIIKVIIEPITGQITGSKNPVLPDLPIPFCKEGRKIIVEAVKSGAIPFCKEGRQIIVEPITGLITGSENPVSPDLPIINCEERRQIIIEAVESGAIPLYGERRQIIIEALKNGESVQIPITV